MPGVKGQITRAKRGRRESVYLSDRFGLFPVGTKLHVTFHGTGNQKLHTNVTEADGLLYDTLLMLYRHGMRLGEEAPGKSAKP
jgi:hypothetical protein